MSSWPRIRCVTIACTEAEAGVSSSGSMVAAAATHIYSAANMDIAPVLDGPIHLEWEWVVQIRRASGGSKSSWDVMNVAASC
jgi:hypothetical protein